MLIGYNQATTLKNSDVETDLKYAEKYGYDYIEFQMGQLYRYLDGHPISQLKDFFASSRIKPYSLNALEFFNLKNAKEFEKVKEEFTKMCDIASELECSSIIVVPSPKPEQTSNDEIKKDSIDKLNILADIGSDYGIKLAYEYLGFKETSVNSFSQCYEIIEQLDRDNVGIVMDCFHFYAGGSNIEDLKRADADKIFVFHLDDCKDLALDQLQDSDRVWPGDGVIPLDMIFDAFKEIGFNGVATIELFNPEYWTWEPRETIRVAKEKTVAAIEKYFNQS